MLLSLLALLAGLAAGVLYSWVIAPMRYVDTSPNTLRPDFKDSYRAAIAAAYAGNHNLERAQARLALLGDPDPVEALTAQAQRMLAAGDTFQAVREVAGLASDLRAGMASIRLAPTKTQAAASPTIAAFATTLPAPTPQTDATEEPTATPAEATAAPAFDTPMARPTRTPVPTASAPFQLVSEDPVCNANLTEGLLQVSVLDRRRHQMPGVEITIAWSGGEESFYTGLKPEIANGYADYVMQAGVIYSVQIERSGTPLSGLSAPSCPDGSGGTYLGGMKLVFQQP